MMDTTGPVSASGPEVTAGRQSIENRIGGVELAKVVGDLLWLAEQCELRCLFECAKWANEQLNHLPADHFNAFDSSAVQSSSHSPDKLPIRKQSLLNFVRMLIINREYNRAKFFLSKVEPTSSLEAFLYYFSCYLISVRDRTENEADELDRKEEFVDEELPRLRTDLEALKSERPELFDSFMHYLLGTVRKESGAEELAIQAFTEAIQFDSRCWPAWESLSALVDGVFSAKIERDPCSQTWLYSLFMADTMYRLQLYQGAITEYARMAKHVGASPHIICQIAAAQSELGEHDNAISSFKRVRKMDPYRIEQMHFYSNSLYIREHLVELSTLAKWFYESHKFYWETCCIVANYYNTKSMHEQSQEFLKRAIRLCPANASIWVLLGHEYMETKNHQLATAAYKKAIAIDSSCYRAWYGMGQLYEILKQPSNALYYHQRAHKCRPADSRILIALGVLFSKLDRKSDAEKCFKKAFQIGDMEGNALIHLAKLYEDQDSPQNAAKAYEAYLTIYTEEQVGDLDRVAISCRFLARHNLELDNLDKAYELAQRCLNFELSKEEGHRILRLIMSRRQELQQEARRTKGEEEEGRRRLVATPQNGAAGMAGVAGGAAKAAMEMKTPVDAPRPPGGGQDDSALERTQTPQAEAKQEGDKQAEVQGGGDGEEDEDDAMNTNSDDDDLLEVSF